MAANHSNQAVAAAANRWTASTFRSSAFSVIEALYRSRSTLVPATALRIPPRRADPPAISATSMSPATRRSYARGIDLLQLESEEPLHEAARPLSACQWLDLASSREEGRSLGGL